MKKYILIVSFILGSQIITAQDSTKRLEEIKEKKISKDFKDHSSTTRDTILILENSATLRKNAKRKVLLYEDSLIIIESNIDFFKQYSKYGGIASQIVKHSIFKTVNAKEVASKQDNQDDASWLHTNQKALDHYIAEFIDRDKCWIIDKHNNSLIHKISRREYSFICGSLCGEGGRMYFINSFLFLKVVDWVS